MVLFSVFLVILLEILTYHKTTSYRTRMSVRELERPENDAKRFAFLKAWQKIKALPPSNPNSFWAIACYHGKPFKKRNVEVPSNIRVWNGYSQHSNVLFLTWHRRYILRMEQALQTVCPDDDVAMHYWDMTSEESLKYGLPNLLIDDLVVIDVQGNRIPNPLLNFKFPERIPPDNNQDVCGKEKGYVTTRYPMSGIQSPKFAKEIADKHNEEILRKNINLKEALQRNIIFALNMDINGQFEDCLRQDNYNVFSNKRSAGQIGGSISLESPHDDIHMAIGGYTYINHTDMMQYDVFEIIPGANGDISIFAVASFDPIFYFLHSNIDRIFWVWQKKWNHTKFLEIDWLVNGHIDPGVYPHKPSPNQGEYQRLTMDTQLFPFQKAKGETVCSRDVIDIEGQLGYTYTIGSYDHEIWPIIPKKYYHRKQVSSFEDICLDFELALRSKGKQGIFYDLSQIPNIAWKTNFINQRFGFHYFDTSKMQQSEVVLKFLLNLEKINNDDYPGSFMLRAYRKVNNGNRALIGQHGVFKPWNGKPCVHCQRRSYSSATFEIPEEFYPKFGEVPALEDYHVVINYKDPFNGREISQQLKLQSTDNTKLISRFLLLLSEK